MSFEEFAAWLGDELREGRLSEFQVADLLAQRMLFDDHRAMLESEFRRQVVGYIANELRSSRATGPLLDLAAREFPGRMLYFEPIGYRIV